MIQLSNITKKVKKRILLDDVTLRIPSGGVYGLLGANGAGKSTLISILAGVTKPTSGHFSINGYDSRKESRSLKGEIGYVPQEIALWEDLSVMENLELWSRFTGKKIAKDKRKDICEAVRLTDRWDDRVADLSGGMKRKLNIATALLHDPPVLLMDEPTVGIDLQSKLEINQFINKLASDGKTIVYITHDINEIMQLCNRIGVLSNSRLIYDGTLDEAAIRLNGQQNELDMENVLYKLLESAT